MNGYSFIYRLNPISVNHYWSVKCVKKRPVVYKTKLAKHIKEIINWQTVSQLRKQNKKAKIPLFNKPDKVTLKIFYFYSKKPKDIDNILKVLIDSLEGILFENDSQISELYIRKEKSDIKENYLKVEINPF